MSGREYERRATSRLLDVLIRAGIIVAVAVLCYRIFAPFLTITVMGVILAVTFYPLQCAVVEKMHVRPGIAATMLVFLSIALLILPVATLMISLGDTIQDLITRVQTDTIQIPAPPDRVATWPLVGSRAYATWARAHDDLPGLVQTMQPKIGELARAGLAFVASIAGALLAFLAALILAGIIMAFANSGARASRAIFGRIAGTERGEELTSLSTATIRAVAQGVVGVALLQAVLVGLCLMIARVPWTGALAAVVLVLGIAQVPAVIVTLPVIVYIWAHGDYSRGAEIIFTILLLVAGMADNVLKPLMLGRGVNVPMPVILVGALGGMAASGIVGLFVGATLLALVYTLVTEWVTDYQR